MMKRKRIYIIGDLFMKVAYFKKALVNRIGDDHLIKTLQLNWPDEYTENRISPRLKIFESTILNLQISGSNKR